MESEVKVHCHSSLMDGDEEEILRGERLYDIGVVQTDITRSCDMVFDSPPQWQVHSVVV